MKKERRDVGCECSQPQPRAHTVQLSEEKEGEWSTYIAQQQEEHKKYRKTRHETRSARACVTPHNTLENSLRKFNFKDQWD